MRAPFLCSVILLASTTTMMIAAEETVEVLRFPSPDAKFAMRIVCEAKYAKAEDIPAHAVRSVNLVALPGKTEAASLVSEDDVSGFAGLTLAWSADSQWCAFYSRTQRIGYTKVFRRKGEGFTKVADEDDLTAPHDVDIRNEYVSPVRWLKPGVLILKHRIIPRGDGDGLNVQFTATYYAKAGKFRIGGVKKLAQ
jgi:hypothetical protein